LLSDYAACVIYTLSLHDALPIVLAEMPADLAVAEKFFRHCAKSASVSMGAAATGGGLMGAAAPLTTFAVGSPALSLDWLSWAVWGDCAQEIRLIHNTAGKKLRFNVITAPELKR